MAEGKADLKDDPRSAKPVPAKDDASRGNDETKIPMGLLDEPNDQVISENSIPLSPQWLYAKPIENKPGLSTATAFGQETRIPNFSPQGISLDSVQKEAWRLDTSQDKKEWRRNVPDTEINRRWREEERETGLLGRRERRKEGDRENEYRKNDRRSENISVRETSDSRNMQSSDRWHEVTGRNSGHESRRDSKWSSRWGPEDKGRDSRMEKKIDAEKEDPYPEKQSIVGSNRPLSSRWGPEDKGRDSRMEKKMDAEKEDPYPEKQSIVGSNRPLSESDTRDKWRPRHRQEVHSGGSAGYRAAPGFGVGRGRTQGSSLGFAIGRGRSNFHGGQPFSRVSSAGPIGAALTINIESLSGGSSFHADTFRYPRGKLLDIYRKLKVLPPVGTSLDGFEEVPLITQSSSIEPLALVKPDTEEQAVLDDIWKGKVASSEAFNDSGMDKIAKVGNCEIGPDFNTDDCEEKVFGFGDETGRDVMTSSVLRNEACSNIIAPSSLTHPKKNVDVDVDKIDRNLGILDFLTDPKFGAVSSSPSYDVGANNLFDAPFIQQMPGNDLQLHNNSREVEHLDQSTRGELSLFYLDPQGEIQGPFLAEDIISWYEDGYFGTDLPVCFSDAPGTSFLPLGEVIPQLSLRPQSSPLVNPCVQSESSDPFRGNMEANSLGTILSSSSAINAPERTASSSGSLNHPQPRICESEDRFDSHFEKLPVPILDVSAVIPGADEGQSFQDLSGQDAEEVLYTGRPASKIGSSFMKFSDGLHDISRTPDAPQYLTSEMARANSPDRMFPTDNDLNPLGLSWSELESAHQKGPLSSNIGLTDQGRFINPLVGGDVSSFRRNQEHFSLNDDNSVLHDAWSSNYIRNNSSNVLHDAMNANHLPRFEPESAPYNMEQHLLSQQYEKQKLQQQHHLSPYQNNRSFLDQLQGSVQQQQAFNQRVPDMEHYLKLHSQQRHLQELEQQQQLHQQQQQIHHRMQLLQQQRQQQLQQQQQRLLQEQLLHQQLRDHNIESLRIDPLQGRNTLDQVLHRHHLLQELQQQTHHLARNHDPSIDRLVQAKFGHDLHHEHHPELTNALLHSSRRHMLPLEQQILLGLQEEQMQVGQLPIASRQPLGREEGSHVGRFWSVDESGQYIRPGASPHLDHSSRLGQLDSMHSFRRPLSFEQPGQFERNFELHDLMQRGNYEPSLHPFERSASFSEPNMDVLNALARLQETGMQEHHRQMGQSSSGHSYQDWMSKQLSASNLDAMERSWPESNAQLRNNLRDPQFTQLHLALEKQKRDMEADPYVGNPARWPSIVGNDENSNHELAELLHQRSVHQSSELSELVGGTSRSSYENRTPSFLFSRPTTDHFVSLAENDAGLGESFTEGSLFTNLGQASQARPTNINLKDMSGRKEQFADARGADISKERTIFSDMREGAMLLNRGGKGIATSSILDPVKNEVVQAGSCAVDPRLSKVNGPVRHASFDSTGGVNLYNYETGTYGTHIDDIVNERISGIFSKGPDSSPLNLTSSELVPATTPMNGKRQISIPYSDGEGRRELADNLSARAPEISASSKKDVRFRRTWSYSDADAPEASSFMEMLKKPAAEADVAPEDAGTAGGKGSKKKGKKGRQIDPSLLGFKVHSNRILMGEIQRPED